ncbi:TolC family protein [Parapedobacter indicus]|uniref:Outer membrane protein TolC n=1 Tax=Parapedobacter indicus TaxID=1477437 RepID=A0A1I3J2H1_9SPHI|nr:TolC family protein [Parapedobacter indicus]PPL02366.1 outer membrane protein TolC [Parapedobacter indicus]SFI54158.1 Outer membrane protein TolC [Parapedobacter indicus]
MNKSISFIKSGFVIGSLLIGGIALGQQSRPLSLADAVAASLAHSNELKIDDSKISGATAAVQEAKNSRLPDIDVSGQYLRVNEPHLEIKFASSGENSNDEGSAAGSFPAVNQAMFGMATASLPLFTGGKINQSIASAKFLETATRLDALQDRQHIIQNTVAAYYNLYKAQAAVELVKENLKSSQQRVRDFQNLEANGIVARNDLLKVQLQQSNLELALINAENNASVCNYNVNLMLGLDSHTALVLDTVSLAEIPSTQSEDKWEINALDHRADYQALAKREQAAQAGVKIAKSAYYPALAISVSYMGANIPHALTITNAVNAGLGLSYNLGSLYKASAKVKQAKAQEEELMWHRQQLNEGIKSEIHQAYLNYVQSLKKIEVYRKATEQANENYRITKNKHDNSLATTTDLLDADVAKLQAQLEYAYAKADAAVAYHKLHESAGVEAEIFTAQHK